MIKLKIEEDVRNMSISATQPEALLEKSLIKTLKELKYELVEIPDEKALIDNFKTQIEKHNIKNGNINRPFSDKEFEKLLFKTAKSGKGVFQSAINLRQKQDIELDSGKKVYIELFNKIDWCKNKFQVSNQITIKHRRENRYDVTILINGIPLVQVELKRRGMEIKQAFNQVNRYKRESFKGLFNYTQLFVISNGVNTKYAANSDKQLRFEQSFFWTDEANKKINDLDAFAKSFFRPCQIAKMIAKFMVISDTDKALMVMRPYQIYAVEKLIHLASETRNNGYVWHTTGSGKTLTSFKLAQLLTEIKEIEKVIFLVDRKDLDAQTLAEFNKFEKDSVDMTDKTTTLVKQFGDPNNPLIISTIQKMDNAIKNKRYQKTMEPYKNKRVVFIIDECHRTQFGAMHKRIKKHFDNAQYFGFTGTPIFEETANNEMATGDLFGKQVHHYLIKDGIADGNVLGFKVDYLKSYDINPLAQDVDVEAIDTTEVIESDKRVEEVVKKVLEIHPIKTNNREFNALFAASSIKMANKYYEKFQEHNNDLVIARIFSYQPNDEVEEGERLHRDQLEEAIKQYNQQFDTNFSTDTFAQYFSDVSKRFKNKEIDILIVVNMFLTGYDSKMLNTLYLDKKLKYHNLIQAFSRTNRVHSPRKPFGNIVSFLTKKKDVDDAVYLYSKSDATDTVLLDSYETYVENALNWVIRLKNITPTIQSVDDLEVSADKREFIEAFRGLTRVLTTLRNFLEFEFNETTIGISEQEYADYKSKYLDMSRDRKEKEKVSVLADVDFEIELLARDKVDVDYILNLLSNIDFENEKRREKDLDRIRKILDQSDTEDLHSKIELLRKFIENVIPTLEKEDVIEEEYNEFLDKEINRKINYISEETKVEPLLIKEFVADYQYSNTMPHQRIRDNVSGKFIEKKKRTEKIRELLEEIASLY